MPAVVAACGGAIGGRGGVGEPLTPLLIGAIGGRGAAGGRGTTPIMIMSVSQEQQQSYTNTKISGLGGWLLGAAAGTRVGNGPDGGAGVNACNGGDGGAIVVALAGVITGLAPPPNLGGGGAARPLRRAAGGDARPIIGGVGGNGG
jgi:hypothetical protein